MAYLCVHFHGNRLSLLRRALRPWSRRMSYRLVVLLRQIKLSRLSVFNSFGPLGVIGKRFQWLKEMVRPNAPQHALTQAHSRYVLYIFFRPSTMRHTCKASNLLDNRLDVWIGIGLTLRSGFCLHSNVAGWGPVSRRQLCRTWTIELQIVVLYCLTLLT